MSVLPKLIYRFNTVPIKIPAVFVIDTDKLTLKFTLESQGTRPAKTLLEENNTGGLTLLDFKTYCEATVIKTARSWRRTHVSQAKSTERPDKAEKWLLKKVQSQFRWTSTSTHTQKYLELYFIPYTKLTWNKSSIISLNIKCKLWKFFRWKHRRKHR